MFVRLTILRTNSESLQPQGLFGPAYALRRSGDCPAGLEHWLDDTLGWLEDHLYSPYVSQSRAVFWLRDDWQILVEQLWSLAVVLREAGENVQLVTTRRPGYVVYEDECQIAAVPFRDTYCR
ncbi:MAG: hypothetical protein GY946_23940 [bacterium]|nr:hypothetical protein [bacterium]